MGLIKSLQIKFVELKNKILGKLGKIEKLHLENLELLMNNKEGLEKIKHDLIHDIDKFDENYFLFIRIYAPLLFKHDFCIGEWNNKASIIFLACLDSFDVSVLGSEEELEILTDLTIELEKIHFDAFKMREI